MYRLLKHHFLVFIVSLEVRSLVYGGHDLYQKYSPLSLRKISVVGITGRSLSLSSFINFETIKACTRSPRLASCFTKYNRVP